MVKGKAQYAQMMEAPPGELYWHDNKTADHAADILELYTTI